MAEARTEDEEERLGEARGGRNQRLANASSSSSERAERNKPEQRHTSSQGALSSIRAVIKRTSNRTAAPTEPSRDRRRPEITILSAEPLATNNWFPGASGAFPPPPPPAHSSWASGGLTVQLPPPSYEQVIREKSREQSVHSTVSSSSSSSPTPRRSTVTIATQTDTDSSSPKKCSGPPARRPPKPPRPSLPLAPKPAESAHTPSLVRLEVSDLPCTTHTAVTAYGRDILNTPQSKPCEVQTDFDNIPNELALLDATPTVSDSSHISNDPPLQHSVKREVSGHPRPRPRSKAVLHSVIREEVLDQPMTREVKVQTLVRLKDDGAESVFAGFTDTSSDISSNKYLQELLDVFSYDEQGFQDDQASESDQSEESEEEEEEVAFESHIASSVSLEPLEPLGRPEPKPRTNNPKQTIAPKPSKPMHDAQETSCEEKSKQILNPPVPAPRPLLTKKSSKGNSPEKNRIPRPPKPPVAARRSVVPTQAEEAPSRRQTAAAPPKASKDEQNVDQDQDRNASAATVETAPVTLDKCPPNQTQLPAKPPSQKRPPPPSSTNAQADGEGVNKDAALSIPALPPRPSESRLLPLRPPAVKTSKSAGPSHAPAMTQHPAHRVPKRGPPLPPRPKPGHPLYRDYISKVPQGNALKNHPGTEPEEQCLQKEEPLLVLDDTPTPTQTASVPGEVKGQVQGVCGGGGVDVCTVARDEPISQQKPSQEVKREQQKEKQPQPNTDIRCVARFAFEGQEGELTFCEGDIITVTEYINEEWARGSLNGLTGLFPQNFVQELPSSQRKPTPESPERPVCEGDGQSGRALFDFIPESEDELCLKVGDIVCSLEEVDEEWFLGEFGGKRGMVPKNYIQVL